MNNLERKYCIEVGKAIRDLRIEVLHKSARIFSYENDIPKSTMTRIERGENEAQLVTLKKIAEGFGWSMCEFFKYIEAKLPKDCKIFEDEHY